MKPASSVGEPNRHPNVVYCLISVIFALLTFLEGAFAPAAAVEFDPAAIAKQLTNLARIQNFREAEQVEQALQLELRKTDRGEFVEYRPVARPDWVSAFTFALSQPDATRAIRLADVDSAKLEIVLDRSIVCIDEGYLLQMLGTPDSRFSRPNYFRGKDLKNLYGLTYRSPNEVDFAFRDACLESVRLANMSPNTFLQMVRQLETVEEWESVDTFQSIFGMAFEESRRGFDRRFEPVSVPRWLWSLNFVVTGNRPSILAIGPHPSQLCITLDDVRAFMGDNPIAYYVPGRSHDNPAEWVQPIANLKYAVGENQINFNFEFRRCLSSARVYFGTSR